MALLLRGWGDGLTAINEVQITDLVALIPPAPGVDIRLGVGNDFSEGTAFILRDITNRDFEGRSLTLTIPDRAFDGRMFDSIAVFCWETGETFDWAVFEE